jgi:hypothetical protein
MCAVRKPPVGSLNERESRSMLVSTTMFDSHARTWDELALLLHANVGSAGARIRLNRARARSRSLG